MKKLILNNKKFELYINHKQIENEVKRIAFEITRDLSEKKPLFICLLNGSFLFAADLLRKLEFVCNVSFVKLSSYVGNQSSGNVKQIIGLNETIEGRTVVVVDDIIDTGTTLSHFLKLLTEQKPSEIKIAAMFSKPDAFRHSLKINYLGMTLENKFVVGYGLDFDGLGRNYKDLYKLADG